MNWRLASSLVQLRAELDTAYPTRDRTSDGSIGDAAHASRKSDHNPWVKDHNGQPIVRAIDVDRDIVQGFTSRDLAEWLRLRRDPRVKYVISRGQMFSSYPTATVAAWTWRKYDGVNSHSEHMHISVSEDESLFDNVMLWGVARASIPNATPVVAPPSSKLPLRPSLQLGSAGSDVAYLQRMLGAPDGFIGKWDDGDFGPKTLARVKAFQVRIGVDPSGVVDSTFWAALEA